MDKRLTARVIPKLIWTWFLFLVVESGTQVVFKFAGAKLDASNGLPALATQILTSPWAIGGFLLYFLGFILWMTILRESDVGRAFPITAMIYLTTLAAAVYLFHESLSPLRILGVAAIIAGVSLLASDQNTPRKQLSGERMGPIL